MAFAVAGGKDAFQRRPIASTVVCPTSPLTISPETTEPIIVYAENGAPCTVLFHGNGRGNYSCHPGRYVSYSQCRGFGRYRTGPSSETRSLNLYGSSTTIMDLRSATATIGCPELGMLSAAVAKMAQFYQIPAMWQVHRRIVNAVMNKQG